MHLGGEPRVCGAGRRASQPPRSASGCPLFRSPVAGLARRCHGAAVGIVSPAAPVGSTPCARRRRRWHSRACRYGASRCRPGCGTGAGFPVCLWPPPQCQPSSWGVGCRGGGQKFCGWTLGCNGGGWRRSYLWRICGMFGGPRGWGGAVCGGGHGRSLPRARRRAGGSWGGIRRRRTGGGSRRAGRAFLRAGRWQRHGRGRRGRCCWC